MIKQIQLRGISRTPSDRATEDGGCAESLNIHLDNGESAPTLPPEDVTDELAPGLAESGLKVLYIHKGANYTNYVGTFAGGLYAWVSGDLQSILESSPEPESIASNGNLLVFAFADENQDSSFALFKDGEYIDLGSGVPRPSVTFSVTPQEEVIKTLYYGLNNLSSLYSSFKDSTAQALWEHVLKNRTLEDDSSKLFSESNEAVWRNVDSQINIDRADGIFCAPVLARYAVRLYDGTYVYNSEPILLSGSESHLFIDDPFISLMQASGQSSNERWLFMCLRLANRFKVSVSASFGDNLEKWKDLIESVDIFLSTDIRLPLQNTNLSFADTTVDTPASAPAAPLELFGGGSYVNFEGIEYRVSNGGLHAIRTSTLTDAFENEYQNKANFYLVQSYRIDKLPNGSSIKPVSQDDLVVKQRLEESDSHLTEPYRWLSSFNSRIVSSAQRVTLSPGHVEPHAIINGATGTQNYYTVYYHVRDDVGVEHIVKGYSGVPFVPAEVRGYIAYPDPGCFQADLYFGTDPSSPSNMTILPMKEHPRLNASYGFWGLGSMLESVTLGRSAGSPTLPDVTSETFITSNRLALSEVQNPFSFPYAQRQSFQAKIISALPLTIPLSAYQFGKADIYVFTEDGIWTVALNDEGGIASSHPISRDVACPGTVTQLDNAAIFVSDQGVMLLMEGGATNISPNMNGRHYTVDASAVEVLSRSDWADLIPSVSDDDPFMAFAEECCIAYDYSGRRILLLNREKNYQYVYMFDTQTWHKTSVSLPGFTVLNSYPQCLVSTYGDGARLMDFSTVLDKADVLSDTVNPVRGIIITRTLDLGEPDVRKTVKDLRIRGRFNRGDVKYMMYGSFDGVHWKRLISKRGGSYKLFRFVILTNLSPTERISWIDVDYEGRLTNKLR